MDYDSQLILLALILLVITLFMTIVLVQDHYTCRGQLALCEASCGQRLY